MLTTAFSRASLALTAMALLAAPAWTQTTWYFDVHGTPPGQGTPANPYTSIQYALNQSTTVGGDTILVAPGTYVENVSIAKAVLLESSGGPLVTILQPAVNGSVVTTGQKVDATVSGFTVRGGTSGIELWGGLARRCIVQDNSFAGIYVPWDGIALNCTIIGNPYGFFVPSPIGAGSIAGSVIWGNVQDVTFNEVTIVQWCIGLDGGSSGGFGNLVHTDPRLWDLAGRDAHLAPGSPCIDWLPASFGLDPDGSPKDVGALPYDPSYAPAPSSFCSGKLNSQGCVPAIGALGTASATSSAPFVITATNEIH